METTLKEILDYFDNLNEFNNFINSLISWNDLIKKNEDILNRF